MTEALKSAQDATRLEPRNLDVRLTLARSLLASKDLVKAEQEITAITAAAPQSASAHVLHGLIASERKNPSAAKAAFDKARAIDPKSIELLAACQALDLLLPLTTSAPLVRVHEAIRRIVPTLGVDRPPAPDIERISEMIASGEIERACGLDLR